MGRSGTPGYPAFRLLTQVELMFLGLYEHSIDEKGRMTIPFRFRGGLENGAFLVRGFEENLMLMPTMVFEQFSDKVTKESISNPTARELKRLLFSFAEYVKLDESGRILIPQNLRVLVSINSTVIINGMRDFIEIWAPEVWAKEAEKLNDPEANARKFADLDLSDD